MPSTNEVRTAFLDYFNHNGHEIVSSGPLVPPNDPSLLFTNAGMVQFKNVFTGSEQREIPRATTSQKCVRAGGKHNDLDNVGYTARHHTFFEMLGNFSFGDYFKETAIELAWNLVHQEFGLPTDRLLVTVFHSDDDAYDLWKSISGLQENRIIRIDTNDNFWAMGDTGPCGPCSEIFYDHGESIPGGPPGSVNEDGDRFIEIWNLVFMQFEEQGAEGRIDLPNPAIDTGMGLERITAVLQGVHDNYDTDLFKALISGSADLSGISEKGPHNSSHRVIADHLRASSFLLADGVMPSNEGRGYVLRRIMRRAMRHAHMMGVNEPMMWRLVPLLITEMSKAFPELERAKALITETLKNEETRFAETLGRGLRLLEEATTKLADGAPLPGDIAFKLYDTYGFPLDLTEDALRAQGRIVDRAGFEVAMNRQRTDARKSWTGSGDDTTDKLWFQIRDAVGTTEFIGYSADTAEGQILTIVVEGEVVSAAETGSDVMVITNQTPFYAESGGQIGDTGTLRDESDLKVQINNTLTAAGGLNVHIGTIISGTMSVNNTVQLEIDGARRAALRRNHSATHLLHTALRNHLGNHVSQKGSLVTPERLRFDISHPQAINEDDLLAIEEEVNVEILANNIVSTNVMTPDEAIQRGALALFGEKYGDEVRVISIENTEGKAYSIELCGGTHVKRTGDIGIFRIINETAVGSGLRRIEAVTGVGALRFGRQQETIIKESSAALRAKPTELPKRIQALQAEHKKLIKELNETRRKLATAGGTVQNSNTAKDIGGIKFIDKQLEGVPPKDLRGLADELIKSLGSGVVTLATESEGKAAIVVAVSDDLTNKINAVELVRLGATSLGGKGGGGRPDMAQAGGPNASQIKKAIDTIENAIATLGAD